MRSAPAQTESAPSNIIFVDVAVALELPVPDGFTSIDAVAEDLEREPAGRVALEHARGLIADRLYTGSPATIAAMRLRKGWSQQRLANVMGTSQPHVARIEAGRDDLRLSTLNKLASALGVSLLDVVQAMAKGSEQS